MNKKPATRKAPVAGGYFLCACCCYPGEAVFIIQPCRLESQVTGVQSFCGSLKQKATGYAHTRGLAPVLEISFQRREQPVIFKKGSSRREAGVYINLVG
jgi:hypothetical protein